MEGGGGEEADGGCRTWPKEALLLLLLLSAHQVRALPPASYLTQLGHRMKTLEKFLHGKHILLEELIDLPTIMPRDLGW